MFLFHSENAEVAKRVVDELGGGYRIYLGITVEDREKIPDFTDNPHVFSDGTDFNDDGFLYEWNDGFPTYGSNDRCVALDKSLQMFTGRCDGYGKALCYVACPSSASERFRANLPIFALFAAFSAFCALAALVF